MTRADTRSVALRGAVREHAPFLVLLLAGAVVRVAVVVAFPPGFVFSDGPGYLGVVDDLTTLTERPVGYSLLLWALALVSREVWLITAVQHLLGLATAVLAYAVLRRWGVGRVVAALATAPVLLDGMQLVLEHSVLSDVVFDLVVLAGLAVLGWAPRPTVRHAAFGGLVLGAAVCVRVVGQPMLVVAVVLCLVAGATWRTRLVTTVVVCVSFAAPVVAYAGWYHHDHGVWALSESGGRALYMRTTGFVDCSRFTVPDHERPLCPEEPLGQRLEPTEYGWHMPDGTHGLQPPAGVTVDQAMRDFATRAIRAQPGDYARIVVRDYLLNFTAPRVDRYEYDTAEKWTFERYPTLRTTSFTRPAYEAHGGDLPSVRQPWADALVGYGRHVYTWGPLLAALLLLGLVGWLAPGRRSDRDGPHRTRIFVCLATGAGLLLVPDVTAEFVWRYQLPALVFLPMAAALAWTRLVVRRAAQPGTVATPSTD